MKETMETIKKDLAEETELRQDYQAMFAEEHNRRIDRDELIEQLCRDLNQAHDEILRYQGCGENDFAIHDWPEWTPQANSIRLAEKYLGKKLAKTDQWTLFPGTKP